MNDLAELKEFVGAHAKAQRIGRYQEILDRVRTDEGDGAGTWAGEWSAAAERLAAAGRPLEAAGHYNMARFPYVDGPARQKAMDSCVGAFEEWAAGRDLHRVDLDLPGGRVRCWSAGLSDAAPRPLVLICGGIVSIKEQWAPALSLIGRLGMAGVVTEMPGVGENTLRYDAGSHAMFPAILDAVAGRADVDRTYALALSFSGHLALRAATEDRRIRGIITGGAPISAFFTDAAWQAQVPRITMDTIAHLAGVPPERLAETLRPWALDPAALAALDVPVACTASLRDEIIPAEDVRLMRTHLRRLDLVENDDVHGSPRYIAATRVWGALSVLRMHGARNPQRLVLGTLLRLLRARQALAGGRSGR
ncbi:alpha/beta hydrolase [Actinomadura sp. GTD37]|uniref:alpha/beta hydrolase n=1 Tax=Actinomadura sp. GTD37 TaxID=1778030 RepID=UPI0035BF097D